MGKYIGLYCANTLKMDGKKGKGGQEESHPDLRVRGPRRMPTKVLKLTVRKSPCGNGTNTFDKYEMRIHKRVIDSNCTRSDLQQITKIEIGAGIIIEANELD